MSALTIYGFFALANGDHVMPTQSNSSGRSYHARYSTSIACSSGAAIQANLRVYTQLSTPILPNETVAFVIARAYFPPKGHRQPLTLFIDGYAGRGKTFLINTIRDTLRSEGRVFFPTRPLSPTWNSSPHERPS